MQDSTLNKNISIVLVQPRSAGNIGSTARAMKNFGLSKLRLVNPVDFHSDEAYSMACNAVDVLLGARVFKEIKDAAGEGVIVGTTRRKGKVRNPVLTLEEAVPEILKLSEKNPVSILFGREDKGLKNIEVDLCDMLFEIPAHDGYPSVNLSHAVFIVAFSLFTAENPVGPAIETAPGEEVSSMYAHLESVLKSLGYDDRGDEFLLRSIMRNFKRLFGRTGLMQKEVNMLRGILTRIGENRRLKTF